MDLVYGWLRIAWILVAAVFVYDVSVETKQFEIIKQSIGGISGDRRLQVMLIAFAFGALLEGAGGGGAPVAVTGAMLIGLGFPPMQTALLCLVANSAPVAFGGLGNPGAHAGRGDRIARGGFQRHDRANSGNRHPHPALLADSHAMQNARHAGGVARPGGGGGDLRRDPVPVVELHGRLAGEHRRGLRHARSAGGFLRQNVASERDLALPRRSRQPCKPPKSSAFAACCWPGRHS